MNQFMLDNGLTIHNAQELNQNQLETLTKGLTQEAGTVNASPEELVTWPLALAVMTSKDHPIAFLACKSIFSRLVPVSHDSRTGSTNYAERNIALIGGMYTHEAFRGHGLAKMLLGQVTSTVFNDFSHVSATVANCNSLSSPVFAASSYYPSPIAGDLLPQREGKVTYELARNIWMLSQGLANEIQ